MKLQADESPSIPHHYHMTRAAKVSQRALKHSGSPFKRKLSGDAIPIREQKQIMISGNNI